MSTLHVIRNNARSILKIVGEEDPSLSKDLAILPVELNSFVQIINLFCNEIIRENRDDYDLLLIANLLCNLNRLSDAAILLERLENDPDIFEDPLYQQITLICADSKAQK